MTVIRNRLCEGALIRGHASVSLAGFVLDAALFYTSLASGLEPPLARLISLVWTMQATFALNGAFVFRCLTLPNLPRQWACYMASNGVGNLVNYLVFVGLAASRAPLVSERYVALCIGAAAAWFINYSGARLWAFGDGPAKSEAAPSGVSLEDAAPASEG